MTRPLRELQEELLRELGKRLAPHGFAARPREWCFQRSFDGGRAVVHVSFIKHQHDFDATADVASRLDAVEELVHRSDPKRKRSSFTLGAELGNLESGRPYRVSVHAEGDIVSAADLLMAKIESVGLPYLDRYSTPEAVFEVLARDDRDAWLHAPFHADRAAHACALLAVMGRHAEIPALGRRKLEFLSSLDNQHDLADFSAFLKDFAGV